MRQLGLEVKGGPQGAIHVKGHGGVFVDDPPGAPISIKAHRCAHPKTDWLADALFSPAKAQEAMAEGEVAANGNGEIARLVIDCPLPGVEPSLQFLESHSAMGKRRREIEYSCVRRVLCSDSSGLLAVVRLADNLDQRPDIGFIFRSLVLQCCV